MSGMKCFASDITYIPDDNSNIDSSSDSDFKYNEDSLMHFRGRLRQIMFIVKKRASFLQFAKRELDIFQTFSYTQGI